MVVSISNEHTRVRKADYQTNQSGSQSNCDRHHEENIVAKVVGYDCSPAFILKELDHITTRVQVAKSIQSYINICPFV